MLAMAPYKQRDACYDPDMHTATLKLSLKELPDSHNMPIITTLRLEISAMTSTTGKQNGDSAGLEI
jgi:hypothetical protein